eukprot:3922839-Prymnesium_polylepis.1
MHSAPSTASVWTQETPSAPGPAGMRRVNSDVSPSGVRMCSTAMTLRSDSAAKISGDDAKLSVAAVTLDAVVACS